MIKVAIIGAGISGLTLAQALQNHADITIFEKSRGVSGRMSTRRAAPYCFDHGAQYFTARTEQFKSFIAPLIKNGVVLEWSPKYMELDNKGCAIQEDLKRANEPWYVGAPGMNAICKYLAKDLTGPIYLKTRVETIRQKDKWQLMDDRERYLGEFDWVISTAPAEQSAKLLPASFLHHKKIQNIKMQACFSLMLGFRNPLCLPFEAARIQGSDVSWISVNSYKPGRNAAYSLLIQSSNMWADAHCDDDKDRITQHLLSTSSDIVNNDLGKAEHKAIHLWRYAIAHKQEMQTPFLDANLKLAACGDWCVGGRVEAAFMSGIGLAGDLIKVIE